MSDHHFNYYYVTADVNTAVDVLEILKQANVKEDDIGIISQDEEITRAELPEVDLSESSQLPEALRRGALLGSTSGLLAGVLLSVFPAAGLAVGGMAILGMTAGGAALGAWSASMIGISEQSDLVKKFNDSIEAKKTLVFCNITDKQHDNVSEIINREVANGKCECGWIA